LAETLVAAGPLAAAPDTFAGGTEDEGLWSRIE
jgi:hypothetical protein